jgi:hypothetical protein
MPAVLTDTAICDPSVPGHWRAVLDDLRAFLACDARLCQLGLRPPAVGQVEEIVEVHQRLVDRSVALLEPEALADVADADVARMFARAVALAMRLGECVGAGAEVIDTAGSEALRLYRADFAPGPEQAAAFRERLLTALPISAGELAAIEAEVERDLADARRKRAIVAALRAEFGLRADAADLRERVFRLFRALFPDAPLVAEEVELVMTGALVFFCLPHHGTELTTERFRGLPPEGQAEVRAFFERTQRFSQRRFANFPAFGSLTAADVPIDLAARLAARTGLSSDDIAGELGRLVTVLPLAEIDKYVVHDVWGHGWQASMLEFERMYAELAEYADPLRLDESAPTPDRRRQTFGGCFAGHGATFALDESRFRAFVAGELAERLTTAMSAVLAEMLADVAEYKVLALAPGRTDALPSSSLFRNFPTLLDLTLQDLPFYFNQATKVFRLWSRSAERRQRTIDDLTRAGAAPAAAAAAVERAVDVWEELSSQLFAAELACDVDVDGRLRVNVFTRIALNFLGIHRALLESYGRLESIPVGTLPLLGLRDLLVVGASVFFEADRPRNLWRVDEFLTLRFVPLCQRWAAG